LEASQIALHGSVHSSRTHHLGLPAQKRHNN